MLLQMTLIPEMPANADRHVRPCQLLIILTMDTDILLPDDRLANFATGPDYQLMDVIGEGAYGIVV